MLICIFGFGISIQIDLTADQRYSLSPIAEEELGKLNQEVKLDIFLAGKLPPEFQRLRAELETVLTNMQRKNPLLYTEFIDPFDTEQSPRAVMDEMQRFGLQPETVVQGNNQSLDQTVVYPWAILSNGERSVRVALWLKNIGDSPRDKLFRSLSQLEYQLLDGIKRLTQDDKKTLAVLTSHKTSENILIADLLQSLKPYYNLASFDLKALPDEPQTTLENLNRFDLLMVSNPNEPFSNAEKFILDQYQMAGGNALWMVDALALDRDSLFNTTGRAVTFPKTLALDDYFFKQGLRLSKRLLSDLYCAPIVMAQGENADTQYMPFPWSYYPIPALNENHPISKGLGNVWFRFTTPIDTLPNSLKKTVLTASSPLNKTLGVPVIVQLKEATIQKDPAQFQGVSLPLAVMVEGTMISMYKNRIAPFATQTKKNEGEAKTVLISDGNFAESQLDKGQPLRLGFDKWTNAFYQNKRFLQNIVHYLMGNDSMVAIRTKAVEIAVLDVKKVQANQSFIQVLALVLPLVLLLILAILSRLLRRYSMVNKLG